ncbi:hypothetical protein FPCIR_12925 [Fusarium pseudocircinatum]|uniref:Uncharacterized protein n=1 Tax=Fusarium pseudocircinatum TaxID=56676 RepID=A0A8H5NRY9_9HYPO|nr:hypothetical protein FPCIR_12925 [Fusarium pseudocircinatum]
MTSIHPDQDSHRVRSPSRDQHGFADDAFMPDPDDTGHTPIDPMILQNQEGEHLNTQHAKAIEALKSEHGTLQSQNTEKMKAQDRLIDELKTKLDSCEAVDQSLYERLSRLEAKQTEQTELIKSLQQENERLSQAIRPVVPGRQPLSITTRTSPRNLLNVMGCEWVTYQLTHKASHFLASYKLASLSQAQRASKDQP